MWKPVRTAAPISRPSGSSFTLQAKGPSCGRPLSLSTGFRNTRRQSNDRNQDHAPWGYPQDIEELAEGVWRVSTASHGGLKLSRERWEELPDLVRGSFLTPTYAEEDCEEPIARTLLGIGDDRDREFAIKVAGCFDRYAPALPYLRESGGQS